MQISDVFAVYADEMGQIESYLDQYISSDIKLIPEVAHHLIDSGGKRFRPLLHLICSRLCGFTGDSRFPLAASIEFIHTASLLHDDVIDEAVIRRGKTSANHVWGNAASVLVGDFLYSKSFKLMTDDGNPAILKLISTTTNTMSEGEVFQLMKAGDINLTEKEYLKIVEKKTSILISAACAIGGILGNAADSQIEALTRFGMRLGTAFQITDDTLDYVAREEEFGKAIGQDLSEGKLTLPLIRTMRKCTPEEKAFIRKGIETKDGEATAGIMALIHRYDGIPYALGKATACIDEARGFLAPFPDSEAKKALLAITDYIIERRL